MTSTNPILRDPEIRQAFIAWATDHQQHVGCYPRSFSTYEASTDTDTDYDESDIADAVLTLLQSGEIT